MLKARIYRLVEKGSHGYRNNLIFDYVIMALIMLNMIAVILETIPEIARPLERFFFVFETFSIIIFTIEYMIRIYISDLSHPASNKFNSALKYIFSGYGLIDLFAILPFYLPMIISVDLRIIRILRLMRLLRILKMNRYNNSLRLIWEVIKEKKSELAMTGFVTLMILLIASILMYYIEGDVQPAKFSNVIACFWWAIATLTTVGYGDVYPVTVFGKIVSGFIAVLGIGLVALPTGLVSAGFMSKIDKRKKDCKHCPHCGKPIDP
jgi:voltage-gated potassium channel